MNIFIDKNSKIPLYLQIKESLMNEIEKGELGRGSQLPTERELSLKLGVSRNTVSMAYKELARKEVISSISGKGTFITSDEYPSKILLSKEIYLPITKIIDSAIQKAFDLNIQIEDFMFLLHQRISEKKHLLNNIKVAFVECNQEQLYYFSKKLELGTGIHFIPILIDEMYNRSETTINKLKAADLIVTTFFHLQEVEDFLKDEEKNIIPIALDPQIETMVNIARITSPEMKVGLVCLTEKFAERVFKSIKNAGLKYKKLNFNISHEKEEIAKFISENDAIMVSPGRKKEVEKMIGNPIPVIEFIYIPDKGSIDTLKKTILSIKEKEVR